MKFQIKTRNPAIAPHRQAAATLEALPYTSTSKSYIHLGNINPAALVCNLTICTKGRGKTLSPFSCIKLKSNNSQNLEFSDQRCPNICVPLYVTLLHIYSTVYETPLLCHVICAVANAANVKLGGNLEFYSFLKRNEYTKIEVTYLVRDALLLDVFLCIYAFSHLQSADVSLCLLRS